MFITERCVIRLLPEGLTVTEIAPGISVDPGHRRPDVARPADQPGPAPDGLRACSSPSRCGLDAAGRDGMSGAVTVAGLLVAVDGPIATITLNRPEKLNALDACRCCRPRGGAARDRRRRRRPRRGHHGRGRRRSAAGADVVAWSSLAPLDMWRTLDAHGSSGDGPARSRSASRRSPRSTGSPTAAGSNSRWPAICGSPRTT